MLGLSLTRTATATPPPALASLGKKFSIYQALLEVVSVCIQYVAYYV